MSRHAVLALKAAGFSPKQIAVELKITRVRVYALLKDKPNRTAARIRNQVEYILRRD
jgi:DNA-binding CsgD family transcriptional regulator